MMVTKMSTILRRLIFAMLPAVLLVGVIAFPAGAFNSGNRTKALSQINPVIMGSAAALSGGFFVAQAQGFFKAQGLAPTWLPVSTSASAQVAVLLSGDAQFDMNAIPALALAAQQGAPIRDIFAIQDGNAQLVAINSSYAAANGIPSTGNNAKTALAQLLALKGTHITVAVSNTSSAGYFWLYSIAKEHGLSVGLGCSACDINISSVGSTTAQTTALSAGKVDAIVGIVPTVTVANTIEINIGYIPPIPSAAANALFTTTTYIQQHTDTVQATVNAFVESQYFMIHHAAKAEQDFVGPLGENGITSPEVVEEIWADAAPWYRNPVPTKQTYATELSLVNPGSSPPLTLPFSEFCITRFVLTALKTTRLSFSSR